MKLSKRQKLIDYITAFYVMSVGGETKHFNAAWDKLWKKIDALDLFK